MRAMKDSGVEWIGEIPEDWEVLKYKNICDIQNGYPFDSGKFDNYEGYPLIRIRDITSGTIETYYKGEFDNQYIIENNDILVGMDGDFNIRRWEKGSALLNQRCMKINGNNVILANIIFYQLPFGLKIINDLTYATTVKHLSHFSVLNAKVVLPKVISEQEKIAGYLDEKVALIDAVIEKTKQSIEEYKKYKQSLITETVTKGLNPNAPMKDSGIEWIGPIPEHWEVIPFKFLFKKEKDSIKVGPFGSQLKGDDFIDSGKWVYNQRTVLDSNFIENNTFISDDKYDELTGFSVDAGDVLITTRGSIGKVCQIPETFFEGIIHPCIIKFKIENSLIMFDLIELVFNETEFISNQLRLLSNSTTIDVIYSYTLKNILFPFIPIEEQNQIINFLTEKITTIKCLIQQKELLLNQLEAYKRSLIYEVVTGKKEIQ